MRRELRVTRLIAAAPFFFLVTKTVEVPALGRAESLMAQEGDSTQSGFKIIEGQILAVDAKARSLKSWMEKQVKPSAGMREPG